MCTVTGALFGLQAVSSIGQASATNKALEKAGKSATVSAQRQQESLIRRMVEERRAADTQIDSMMRDAEQARSAVALASVESGVTGGASAEVLQEMGRQALEAETGVRRQYAATSQETAFMAQDIHMNLQNKLQELKSQAVSNTDVALQIGQAAVGSYLGAKASGIVPEDATFMQTFFGGGGPTASAAPTLLKTPAWMRPNAF